MTKEKIEDLEAFLNQHDRFQVVREWKELMHVALAMQGRDTEAEQVLPHKELRAVRMEDIQFRLAQFFREGGQFHQALRLLWQFYRGGPTTAGHCVRAHHLAGDILEDLNSYEAARNHFQLTVKLAASDEYSQPDDMELVISSLCGAASVDMKAGLPERANKLLSALSEMLKDHGSKSTLAKAPAGFTKATAERGSSSPLPKNTPSTSSSTIGIPWTFRPADAPWR